jgi:hypothetical protein
MLLTFVLCQKRIRQGGKIETLFTIRLRQLVLFGSIAGYMAFCFIISRWFTGKITWAIPFFIWLFGGPLIWNGIVRYFRNHPPKN